MKKHLVPKLIFFLFSVIIFFPLAGFSQYIKKEDKQYLQKKEDSLKSYALQIVQSDSPQHRFRADSIFTKMFVRALRTPNSFYYPFDSLLTISKLYAPDSSFKIFTWQMFINKNITRQHGAIQMRTDDGSLKLFPLIDKSDVTFKLSDTIADNKGWIGAVYYKILQNKDCDNKTVYTLLGFDENNIRSTIKIVEILTFNNDLPVFGAPYFSFEKDTIFDSKINRVILEFKKDAGARLTYDDNLQMLIVEHLISETNEPKKKWTYVPDGDYEGFKWENCKWVHINKVFNYITPMGQEPVPDAILNPKGDINEEKLKDNVSEDNPAAEKPKPATKPKAKKK